MRTLITTYSASGNHVTITSKHWGKFTALQKGELMHMVRLIYDETSEDRETQILWSTGSHGLVTNAVVNESTPGVYSLNITFVNDVTGSDGKKHTILLDGHELTIAVDFGMPIEDVKDAIDALSGDTAGVASGITAARQDIKDYAKKITGSSFDKPNKTAYGTAEINGEQVGFISYGSGITTVESSLIVSDLSASVGKYARYTGSDELLVVVSAPVSGITVDDNSFVISDCEFARVTYGDTFQVTSTVDVKDTQGETIGTALIVENKTEYGLVDTRKLYEVIGDLGDIINAINGDSTEPLIDEYLNSFADELHAILGVENN